MAQFRGTYFSALCTQPNVGLPSDILEGDPTRGDWTLPAELVEWLIANVGEEANTSLLDGGRWNWAIQELIMPHAKIFRERFLAHFVFADDKDAALFKMMWG